VPDDKGQLHPDPSESARRSRSFLRERAGV